VKTGGQSSNGSNSGSNCAKEKNFRYSESLDSAPFYELNNMFVALPVQKIARP